MTVFVYELKRRIHLTVRDPGVTTNWNLPMASADFRVYKQVQSNIEFVVRNTDRKPIDLTGRTVFVTFTSRDDHRLLVHQQLQVVNDSSNNPIKGVVKLTLDGNTMHHWGYGFHDYHIYVVNADGSQTMLYVDQDSRAQGHFELSPGYYPGPRPSLVLTPEDFSIIEVQNPIVQLYISSALPGNMQSGNYLGLQTIAIYCEHFTGQLWVKGSMSAIATQDETDWFDIVPQTFLVRQCGIKAYTFEANVQWVRVEYKVDPDNTGSIPKVLFRN